MHGNALVCRIFFHQSYSSVMQGFLIIKFAFCLELIGMPHVHHRHLASFADTQKIASYVWWLFGWLWKLSISVAKLIGWVSEWVSEWVSRVYRLVSDKCEMLMWWSLKAVWISVFGNKVGFLSANSMLAYYMLKYWLKCASAWIAGAHCNGYFNKQWW